MTKPQLTFSGNISDIPFAARDNFRPCMKRPIPIRAAVISHPFRVRSMEGGYMEGKPGDLLMCGVDGELYICDRAVFDKTYDWLTDGSGAGPVRDVTPADSSPDIEPLRDHFATTALAASLVARPTLLADLPLLTAECYLIADHMLHARKLNNEV